MNSESSKFQTFVNYVKRKFRQFCGLFPSSLPTGVGEFETWAQSIISTYDLPTAHLDSIYFTLAAMITNLGPKESSRSKYSFVKGIRSSCAKQIAGNVFYEIKMKQLAAQKAQAAEATATDAVAPSGPKQ